MRVPFRQLLLAVSLILPPGLAFAEEAPFCEGRYAETAALLDAAYRYGTLYSGGNFWHGRDNAGATVDLYRLWRGLPDLDLRRASNFNFRIGEGPLPDGAHNLSGARLEEALGDLLRLVHGADARAVTDSEAYAAATVADLATSLGPTPDWWHHAELLDGLTPSQRIVAALAGDDSFLDWLQTVQSASAAVWTLGWHLFPQGQVYDVGYGRLRRHALARYDTGEGIEWAVAASLFLVPREGGEPEGRKLSDLWRQWESAVRRCSASQEVYAAYAVVTFRLAASHPGRIYDTTLLPSGMRRLFAQMAAMAAVSLSWRAEGLRANLARVRNEIGDDPNLLSWLNVARSYAASSIEELIEVNAAAPLDPKTARALNLLSVGDLLRFARGEGRLPEDRCDILKTAFARLFALRRSAEAAGLVAELGAACPEIAEAVAEAMAVDGPLPLRLAFAILALPDPSVWFQRADGYFAQDVAIYYRASSQRLLDLPEEFRTAGFLQRDLETWLLLPHRWGAYRSLRGYMVGALDRVHARNLDAGTWHPAVPTLIPQGPRPPVLEFHRLIAWPEIVRLGPRDGLSRRLSLTLIDWVDEGSDHRLERWFAPAEEMAAALRRVILLNRYNDAGGRDGRALGRIAFELLHERFPDSTAARDTPYWYLCDLGCER